MGTYRRKSLPPCQRCGDEGSEDCPLCQAFLCDGCLEPDYEDHKKEARAHGGT